MSTVVRRSLNKASEEIIIQADHPPRYFPPISHRRFAGAEVDDDKGIRIFQCRHRSTILGANQSRCIARFEAVFVLGRQIGRQVK